MCEGKAQRRRGIFCRRDGAKVADTKYYLAVDIGASSGRHILGWLEGGKLQMQEVYRFPNGLTERGGQMCWDAEALEKHLLAGMVACKKEGRIPSYMAIDTWGVDYALLDENGKRIGELVGYRDSRTNGIDAEVYSRVPEKELYERTGIQKLSFNTVYQLMAQKKMHPEQLQRAKTFLMIPDYLNYCLTGICAVEYTDASTTQLLNVRSGDWDRELMRKLGYPANIFPAIRMPGAVLGHLRPEIAREVGYDLQVVLAASHDTASAVMAMPTQREDAAYLSSGTWSLMGVERWEPAADEKSRLAGMTNEGGYEKRYRYLKNIMGLWMIQSVRRELNGQYSFGKMSAMARETGNVPYRVNVNDGRFLAPDSMVTAVREVCGKELTLPEVLSVIYHSLAEEYSRTLDELEERVGHPIGSLYIIGGGSQDTYLNELTAKVSGRKVYTGVTEATATGNLMCQMLSSGVFADLRQARECVIHSFDVKETVASLSLS